MSNVSLKTNMSTNYYQYRRHPRTLPKNIDLHIPVEDMPMIDNVRKCIRRIQSLDNGIRRAINDYLENEELNDSTPINLDKHLRNILAKKHHIMKDYFDFDIMIDYNSGDIILLSNNILTYLVLTGLYRYVKVLAMTPTEAEFIWNNIDVQVSISNGCVSINQISAYQIL